MPFVTQTPPNLGDPTRLSSFALAVISNLNYLYGQVGSLNGAGIINGSFEAGNGNIPNNWQLSIASGNSAALVTTAAYVRDGSQSYSMTTPGATSGGVQITTGDFYRIGELQELIFGWWNLNTAATILNEVMVLWYDNTQTALGGTPFTTLYSNSTSNPTSWTYFVAPVQAPTGARYFKLQILGVNNGVAGTAYWDGVTYSMQGRGQRGVVLTSSASVMIPSNSDGIVFEGWGGGGGGSYGGSGANGTATTAVVNGLTYTARAGRGAPNASTPGGGLTPVIYSNGVQFGTVGGTVGNPNIPNAAPPFQNAAGSNYNGQANTGQGGGTYTGATGSSGEYAKFFIPITSQFPNAVAVTVGAGGNGDNPGQNNGATGLAIITY